MRSPIFAVSFSDEVRVC